MEYIVTSSEMQKIDATTIKEIGIPGMVLMEKASLKMFQIMVERFDQTNRICIVAGCGNNGGDGLALGRMLIEEGYDVTIQVVGNVLRASDQFMDQMQILMSLGIKVEKEADYNNFDILVDAIFGVGLSRPIEGHYKEVIEAMNAANAYKIAVDAPSGICCTTGNVLGVALKCDLTITFGLMKRGLLLYPGHDYAGEVIVSNIGFPKLVINALKPTAYTFTAKDLGNLPARVNHSNKGTYGKVLIVAGAKNMAGACYLSAKAAYMMGAGLVQILTDEANRTILQTLIPEAVMTTYESDLEAKERLEAVMGQCKSVVIGPGMGVSERTKMLLEILLKNYEGTLIIDADACNVVNDVVKRSGISLREAKPEIIFTPHLKEASRMTGVSVSDIIRERFDVAEAFAKGNDCVLVLKDARTVVTDGDGFFYINSTGNNGMSTGGSGDVLSGIIAGIAAGAEDVKEAASLGVFIHGRCGDFAAEEKGVRSLMAGDLLEYLPAAIR
ncbi:MAG: NAD(P)H-hydrate dehydratase [Lachnospiraceae bacterium]|nr:NAD(P)H-hydrate dehydratase [Lachnospiraceae bacterium]